MVDTTSPIASLARAVWWLVLIRGIVAIVFGILALVAPLAALIGLTILFAAYALVDGVMTIAHAVRVRATRPRWGWLLVQGIASVIAGILAAVYPLFAGFVLALFVLWIIGFWSIIGGVTGLMAAGAITGDTGRKVWSYIAAVLSILFGIALLVLVILTPGASVMSLVWLVGAYAIVFGVLLVVLAVTTRGSARRMTSAPTSV